MTWSHSDWFASYKKVKWESASYQEEKEGVEASLKEARKEITIWFNKKQIAFTSGNEMEELKDILNDTTLTGINTCLTKITSYNNGFFAGETQITDPDDWTKNEWFQLFTHVLDAHRVTTDNCIQKVTKSTVNTLNHK